MPFTTPYALTMKFQSSFLTQAFIEVMADNFVGTFLQSSLLKMLFFDFFNVRKTY
jgi:hypothetical protein